MFARVGLLMAEVEVELIAETALSEIPDVQFGRPLRKRRRIVYERRRRRTGQIDTAHRCTGVASMLSYIRGYKVIIRPIRAQNLITIIAVDVPTSLACVE